MILNDLEVAAKLESSYFTGEEALVKRRVRAFLKGKVNPIEKTEHEWLWLEEDIFGVKPCSNRPKEKAHRITKSLAQLTESAFEEAQRLLS